MKRKNSNIDMQLHWLLNEVLWQIDDKYHEHGGEVVVTSGGGHEDRHSHKSLHYAIPCCAVDIRTWEWGSDKAYDGALYTDNTQYRMCLDVVSKFCRERPELREGDIDVVLEIDHMHLELNPKRREL